MDRVEVRVFTLADHAAAEGGKLYINGAGVGQMFMGQIPGPLGPLWLVARLRIPWHLAGEPVPIQIRALDADRSPIGQDPVAEIGAEVGRPAGSRPGDELAVNVVLGLGGFPIQSEGSVFFHLVVGGETLGILPLKIQRLKQFPPGSQLNG